MKRPLMQDRSSEVKATESPQLVTFDAIMPAAMAARAEESGVKRVATDPLTLFVLSILAGAFIAFGAIFATTVTAGSIAVTTADGATAFSAGLPYGVVRLLAGLVFSLGLILVIVGGAELFTGNNLIVMAWASRKVKTRDLLLNWTIAFTGNFVGAFMTAVLMFYMTQYTFGAGSVGLAALTTANGKTSLAFVQRWRSAMQASPRCGRGSSTSSRRVGTSAVLDPATNGKSLISRPESRVGVLVMPTDEELMIAQQTLAFLPKHAAKSGHAPRVCRSNGGELAK